jgi:hypothetical protein
MLEDRQGPGEGDCDFELYAAVRALLCWIKQVAVFEVKTYSFTLGLYFYSAVKFPQRS